jgi:uncharacterized protein (DUF342 family)
MTAFPGLDFSEAEGRLIAHAQPDAQRPELDSASLRSLLAQAGYAKWFLFEDALAALATRCNAVHEAFEMPVGERRDGCFTLDVASDSMSAEVTLTPAYGGRDVVPEDIVSALNEAGVVFGIDMPALQQACAAGEAARIVAASAVLPQNGEDARFELLVEVTRDRAPHVNEAGLIDFRELGAIPMVEAGEALMRRIPPTPGVGGHDVFGRLIPAIAGREQGFAGKLAGTCLDAADPDVLRAAVKGQPVRVDAGVLVEQVVHVPSVNMASGNISFDGSVYVEGEVLTGMQVHASGDIVVNGAVDGGLLEAGGNIQVEGGIIAHAKVRAGGSVSARFVENSQIYAGTTIAIDDMALQSELQALNQIAVGIKSPQRGRLVGGSARAMMLVRAPMLGADAGSVTTVQVGVNPELEARFQALVQLAEKQKADEENLQKLVQTLTKTGDKNGMLDRAKASWQKALQDWAQSLQEKGELEKQLAMTDGARVEVVVGVAGAVSMAFGNKVHALRRSFDAGVFSLADGRLVFTGAGGQLTDVG